MNRKLIMVFMLMTLALTVLSGCSGKETEAEGNPAGEPSQPGYVERGDASEEESPTSEGFDPEEDFYDTEGSEAAEENYAAESFDPAGEDVDDDEPHFGPAAAAREKAAKQGSFDESDSNENENITEQGTGGKRGPKAYAREREEWEAERDGGNTSGENGYMDWDGDYYTGSKTYVVAGSDTELLDKDAVSGMSDKVLRLAINEIYARHGRKFNSEDLQDFFGSKEWYTPKYEPEEFDKKQKSILNDIEIKNLEIMAAERSRRGN